MELMLTRNCKQPLFVLMTTTSSTVSFHNMRRSLRGQEDKFSVQKVDCTAMQVSLFCRTCFSEF